MDINGVSHIRLSTADLEAAVRFYVDALAFEPIAVRLDGADLVAGDTWITLALEPAWTSPADDGSRITFHVDRYHFDEVARRLRDAGARIPQESGTGHGSLNFADPDGHRLAISPTTLSDRIGRALADTSSELTITEGALERARRGPSLPDPHKPRRLVCAPVGVFVVVVDNHDRVLLLREPITGHLEVPNGAMEHGEAPADAAGRELKEEAGSLHVGVMCCCAAFNVDYHPHLPPLLSVGFVCRLISGVPVAGDDMARHIPEWRELSEIDEQRLVVPADLETLAIAIAVLKSQT